MKGFLKIFFASLLALLFAAGCLFLLFVVFLGAMASFSKPAPQVADGSILVFDMSANVQDRPVGMSRQEFIDQAMGGEGFQTYSLLSLTRALEEAAEDERIKGLLLTGSFQPQGYGSGFAALKEARQSIEAFAASGKPVWAYVVYPTSRDLYVVSAADTVYMNPEGIVADSGMAMTYPYLAGFMEKYGVGVQVTRAGEYKAAAESFVLEKMSEPAREANEAVLEDFWHEYLDTIAGEERFSPEAYEDLLNELGLLVATDAKELGLVDELVFLDQLIDDFSAMVGKGKDGKSFRQTAMSAYAQAVVKPMYSSDGFVAVVYAEGSIVHGEGKPDQVGGNRIAREIRELRQNDQVKALVLRVNSPGGSALASEVILRELRLAREKMPVIVSMGTVAASGGYWISTYADKIFAQPNTLTGSIGVIGVFFNFEKLASDQGVNFDTVKVTEHADVLSVFREKSEKEMGLVQRQVDVIYDSFLAKVAEGRDMELEAVQAIAGGRIWSGVDALEIGLVDELGGLRQAIAYAGEQAGLGAEPAVMERPEAKNFLDELLKGVSQKGIDSQVRALEPLPGLYREVMETASRFNDPKGVYSVLPYTIVVE